MNPYEALTTTLQGPGALQKEIENNPLNPLRAVPSTKVETPLDTSKASNPYEAITMNLSAQQVGDHAAFDVQKKATDEYNIEHPGFVQSAKNAVVDTVTHPIDTFLKTGGWGVVDSAVLLLNVPQLVMDLPDIVQNNPVAPPTPGDSRYLGTKLVDTMRKTREEAYGAPTQGQKVIQSIGETVVPFLVGAGEARLVAGAIAPRLMGSTLGKAGVDVVGNVAAGQLIVDPQATLEERKQQAKFDAIFGIGAEVLALGGPAAIRKYRQMKAEGKPIPDTVPPEMLEKPVENPFVKSDEALSKAEIKYEPKANLGLDANGKKKLANIEYDYETGNAIVYYLKSFDNPNSKLAPYKQYMLDLEHGHIIDKRLNNGTNISAEFPNPEGNLQNLSNALNFVAQDLKITVQEASKRINDEVKLLSKGKEPNEAEAFSVAYAEFRKDPELARKEAPTFYKFMTQPIDRRFVTKTTTIDDLQNLPIEVKQAIIKEERVQVGDNNYKLTGASKKQYLDAKEEYQNSLKSIDTLKQTNPEQYKLLDKEFAKEFETKVRDITGDLSPSELKNRVKGEMEPYKGKTVTYMVGKTEHSGTIIGKAKDGKIRIADENGAVLVEPKNIVEKRTAQEIEAKVRERKNVEKYDPRKEKSGIEAVRELNKKVTTQNNKEVVEETLKGMRENKRINTDANLAKFSKDNNNPGAFKADTKVTIWRAGTGEIKVGDFVTTSRERAEAYLKERAGTTLFKSKAQVKDLVFADGRPKEYVYAPQNALGNKAKVAPKPKQSTKTVTSKKVDSFEGSTGLDTGKRIEDRPSINYDKLKVSDDVKDMLKKFEKENNYYSEGRMRKTNEKVEELANLVQLTIDDLEKSTPGSIVNTETMRKARQIELDLSVDMFNFLKGYNPANATKEQVSLFNDKLKTLTAIKRAVAGFRTEGGTFLNSLKKEITPGENATLNQLAEEMQKLGLDDSGLFTKKLDKMMTLTPSQRLGEQFFSVWYSAILSGPKTQARNIFGNFANILTSLGAKLGNPAQWKEIPAATEGLVQGLKEGIPEFGENMRDALLQREYKGMSSKFIDNINPSKPQVWKNDKVNRLYETVGAFMGAQDTYFKNAAKSMEEAALKVYSPEMSEALKETLSEYYGRKSVFHGIPKSGLMKGALKATNELIRYFPPAKIIIPFRVTVANILDTKIDYLPIFSYFRKASIIDDQIEEMVKMTGYKLNDAERELVSKRIKDHMIGKAVFGTAFAGLALGLAQKGDISGTGPSNYDERLQLQRTGWRPNSIKVANTWIPYSNLGPLSGIFSMVGNAHDRIEFDKSNKSTASLVGYGMLGWMQSELSASFLQGAADLLDAIKNPEQGGKYIEKLGIGLVPIPAAYTQTKDMIFRQQYETNGITDAIRNRLGLTGNAFGLDPLHPRLDAFGEPMKSDLIYGLSPSKENASLIDQFLIANDIVITIPKKTQDYVNPRTREKVEFTPEEYEKYVKETGNEIYQKLEDTIPYMQNMDTDQRKEYVDKMVQSIRKAKRNEILYGK